MTTKTSIFILLGFCIIAVFIIAGCTQQTTVVPASTATPSLEIPPSPTSAGIANPALENCVKVGGKIEIRSTTDGREYWMCVFAKRDHLR